MKLLVILYGLTAFVPNGGTMTVLLPDVHQMKNAAGLPAMSHYGELQYDTANPKTQSSTKGLFTFGGEDVRLTTSGASIQYLSLDGKLTATPNPSTFILFKEVYGSAAAGTVNPGCTATPVKGGCGKSLRGRLALSGNMTVFPVETSMDMDNGSWPPPGDLPRDLWAFRGDGTSGRLSAYEGEFSSSVGIAMDVPVADDEHPTRLTVKLGGNDMGDLILKPATADACLPYLQALDKDAAPAPCYLLYLSNAPQHQGNPADPFAAGTMPDHFPLLSHLLKVRPPVDAAMYPSRRYVMPESAGNPHVDRCPGGFMEH